MAVNRMKNATIHDALIRAGEAPTRIEKIDVLREHNTLALRDVLKGAYDDTIQFIVPKGVPPYTPSRPESIPSNLKKQSAKFRFFIKGGPGEQLPRVKVEQMFVKILEVVHPDDAVLMIKMKDKELEGFYKGITKKLVMEAFPGLIRV